MFPIFQVIGVDNWQKGNAEINAYVGLDESSAESIGNILELLEMPTSSPAKIEKLPSISIVTTLFIRVRRYEGTIAVGNCTTVIEGERKG